MVIIISTLSNRNTLCNNHRSQTIGMVTDSEGGRPIMAIQEYQFEIIHRKAKENINTDALSLLCNKNIFVS